jgi:propionyl-CoA carboxylase alpha chain
MLAKVIAWAPTRTEAARRLAAALAGARLHGVVTNRDLLVAVLGHDEFLAGDTDTGFLDRHSPADLTQSRRPAATTTVHAVAAALATQAANRAAATVWADAPSGWRNVPSQPQRIDLAVPGDDDRRIAVTYAFGRDGLSATVDGDPLVGLVVIDATPTVVDLEHEGIRRRLHVSTVGDRVDVDSSLGSTTFAVVPRFVEPGSTLAAGSLVAPMPGSVVRIEVGVGDVVTAGQRLLVLEAMKMEHPILAPADGTVASIDVGVGEQVDGGQVLAVVDADA